MNSIAHIMKDIQAIAAGTKTFDQEIIENMSEDDLIHSIKQQCSALSYTCKVLHKHKECSEHSQALVSTLNSIMIGFMSYLVGPPQAIHERMEIIMMLAETAMKVDVLWKKIIPSLEED